MAPNTVKSYQFFFEFKIIGSKLKNELNDITLAIES